MTTSNMLLSVHGANKSYNGIPALIDASLELRSGEVHALMGENGAGKSTLIKLLAGVTAADTMQVALRGKPVQIHSPQGAFDLGLRFIHQELNVVPQLSVAENIFLSQPYPRVAGLFVNWSALNKGAESILSELGISHIAPKQMMARLSPGDQMLVKIASAFVGSETSGASVYVMDEPTAALTGEEAAMLFKVIDRLKARGCAVLYVSHRMEEIFKICDRVTVMRDGRVVATKSIQETSVDDLIRLMTGRELAQVYPPATRKPSSEIVLDVRNLRSDHIQDIQFQLHAGEIIGVAGLIGSGRTELLRALVGADRVRARDIELDGASLRINSPAAAWNKGIAYVPEERRTQGLVISRSISNNVTLPHLRNFSQAGTFLKHSSERSRTVELGDSVKLKARGPRQTARQLSGGNQQKVVFARALAQPTRVLLLDEPTRGVDVGAKFDIYTLIRQISAEGTGILMVSSDLGELLGLSDQILIMHGGHQARIVDAHGLTQEALLALCYGETSQHGNFG